MRSINLSAAELEHDADDPEGYQSGYARLGPSIGASMLGGTVYELPEGAHKVTNRTDGLVRVLMLSTKRLPAVAVYPDSDKIGVFTGGGPDDVMVRRESAVDYWDRET